MDELGTMLCRLAQMVLVLMLASVLLRMESALRAIDLAVTRLDSHYLLYHGAPAQALHPVEEEATP